MPYLLLGLFALALFLYASRYFIKADVRKLAKSLRVFAGLLALIFAAVLFFAGRAAFALPLGAFALMLLGRAYNIPGFGPSRTSKSPGQQSEVRTAYIYMVLDHDSGLMEGEILKGRWRGRALDSLSSAERIDFWRECALNDPQSEQLIAAYLDQVDPDWREYAADGASDHDDHIGAGGPSSHGPMSIEEAYDVLGLKRGASLEDVLHAHRALMKQFHPDQGGSNYLASKINEAKDILLKTL